MVVTEIVVESSPGESQSVCVCVWQWIFRPGLLDVGRGLGSFFSAIFILMLQNSCGFARKREELWSGKSNQAWGFFLFFACMREKNAGICESVIWLKRIKTDKTVQLSTNSIEWGLLEVKFSVRATSEEQAQFGFRLVNKNHRLIFFNCPNYEISQFELLS